MHFKPQNRKLYTDSKKGKHVSEAKMMIMMMTTTIIITTIMLMKEWNGMELVRTAQVPLVNYLLLFFFYCSNFMQMILFIICLFVCLFVGLFMIVFILLACITSMRKSCSLQWAWEMKHNHVINIRCVKILNILSARVLVCSYTAIDIHSSWLTFAKFRRI